MNHDASKPGAPTLAFPVLCRRLLHLRITMDMKVIRYLSETFAPPFVQVIHGVNRGDSAGEGHTSNEATTRFPQCVRYSSCSAGSDFR
jgi:hypothetical protein